MTRQDYIDAAIAWVNSKAPFKLRAKHDDYEDPKVFRNKATNEEFQADLSFVTVSGVKHFTDIAMKTDAPRKLVSKWKLLSLMASHKRGKLYLMAPRGHKAFTQDLINTHNIQAVIRSI